MCRLAIFSTLFLFWPLQNLEAQEQVTVGATHPEGETIEFGEDAIWSGLFAVGDSVKVTYKTAARRNPITGRRIKSLTKSSSGFVTEVREHSVVVRTPNGSRTVRYDRIIELVRTRQTEYSGLPFHLAPAVGKGAPVVRGDLTPWNVPSPIVRNWVIRKGSSWQENVIPQNRSSVISGRQRFSSPRARPLARLPVS